MVSKSYRYITGMFFIISTMCPVASRAITTEQFADKYQSVKNAVQDISFEYEWRIVPPWTFDEVKDMGDDTTSIGLYKDGIVESKLKATRFSAPNDSINRTKWKYIYEEAYTIFTANGKSWDVYIKISYNGKIFKKIIIETYPDSVVRKNGVVSPNDLDPGYLFMSPIGSSIFRLDDVEFTKDISLSSILQEHREMIQATDSVSKVNDFNTVRVDLLNMQIKVPYTRIYCSVDHNYAPVRYEHLKGRNGEIASYDEVDSLEQIADGVWFPTSGLHRIGNEERVNSFQVKGKILVNQGLTDDDFDIKFPVGTRVSDQITGREYKVSNEND